jgi:putative heme-binding domain-containing protein
MNGVLHVVPSLDDVPADVLAASQSTPAENVGVAVRDFVRKWSVVDLEGELGGIAAPERDLARGRTLFTDLACIKCHKLGAEGVAVGPDFATTLKKITDRQMSHVDLLTELVEPSKKIEEKYRVLTIAKVDGTLVSGILVSETPEALHLLGNPLDPKASKELVIVPRTEIEEQLPSQVSLMPEGLINTCTPAEVLDLLAYVLTGGMGHGEHPAGQ